METQDPKKSNDSSEGVDGVPAPEGPANLIDTDYQIGQDNYSGRLGGIEIDLHGRVFAISAIAILFFVVITLALQNQVAPIFQGIFDYLTTNLSWVFLLATNIFLVVCIVLIFTPLAKVRLGGAKATPDFSYMGWFSMLFAAGMGIGLMFYGVSEPITHYGTSVGGTTVEDGVRTDWAPLGAAEGDQEAAKNLAMSASILHYGLHPWAMYAVVALALGLFSFNKGLPLTVRSIFYPVLGERVWGWPGDIIDILAVFATLFGLATSLGLGASQAAAGLSHLFDIPNGDATKVFLIMGITAVALGSILLGVDKGVRRLSEINLVLAALLLLFVIVVGPTLLIATDFFKNLIVYLGNLPALSNPFGREDANYSQGWTAFYYAWWIAWSPFVGMFIARVSRGRTVREFLIAVLLVPSTVSVLWMTAMGGTALELYLGQGVESIKEATLELQLFMMLEQLPLAAITSFVAITLVIVFFITSSDSGSLVIDTMTAGGKVDAPRSQRIFWAIIEGAIAIALLLGGGLEALQAMAVSFGLPFTVILLVGCYAIVKGLMSEPRAQ
ncbi:MULTISPECIES: BCCT family transporter [Halomonadaceae]|uniref:BCCT family transporter n=1 Tax=Vreelandella halophila TaxID=86177 RepID=A0A9X5B722_9GAMM|nr:MULTISPECIES: BCCT family transporter [Halomonas]MYL28108.1 BCCT family transporter [Halomonas utahensis]MYL75874.1 BCCT family transporter [Halomonas sp. 22501_18_FS]